jgi:hypothetical protein
MKGAPMKTVVLDKRFRRSKRGTVMLKNGEACSLKRHFRGALRELVSRLDHFARLSDETFPRAQYKRVLLYKEGACAQDDPRPH